MKDTPLPVYKRVAERDIHEAADDISSSFQVKIDEEEISYTKDTRVSER